MADNIKYRFIQNVGDYFPSGYFSDDFFDKVQKCAGVSNDEVKVKVIHGSVGAINESDVMLANASNAIIVGFNVRPDNVAAESAERDGVDVRMYRVIYDCIEEVQAAIKGMLAPKFRDVDVGKAEVRQVVKISSVVALSGVFRGSPVGLPRVYRGSIAGI